MIYLNIGRRELGKTTLAKYMAHAKSPRLIVDPRSHWDTTADADIYTRVDTDAMLEDLSQGRDVILQPHDLELSVEQLAVVASLWFKEDENHSRQLSVVLDEAGLYKDELREWNWLMRCSPRTRTSIILTAHRPTDIPTNVRALADVWCIFRTTQRHDLDAIRERCGELVERHVQELEPYQFIQWNDARAEMSVHRNGAAWFTPGVKTLTGTIVEEKKPPRLWE